MKGTSVSYINAYSEAASAEQIRRGWRERKKVFQSSAFSMAGRVGIFHAILISACVLAGSAGIFVWHETSALPVSGVPAVPERNSALLPVKVVASPAHEFLSRGPMDTSENAAFTEKSHVIPHSVTPASGPRTSRQRDALTVSANRPAAPIHFKKNPDARSVDPVLLAAYQAYQTGDFAMAGELYTTVLNKAGASPPSRDALLGMAAVAQQQSQDALALRYYSEVLALDPQDPIAHAALYALLNNGDLAGAESRLKILLAQHPQIAPLHFVMGNHYAQQSRWSEAQHAYFIASSLEPDNARYAFNLAVSLDHLGQLPRSAQHYRRALQLDGVDRISAIASFDRAAIHERLEHLTSP
jgi:Tfp pilus assembly protein PilF